MLYLLAFMGMMIGTFSCFIFTISLFVVISGHDKSIEDRPKVIMELFLSALVTLGITVVSVKYIKSYPENTCKVIKSTVDIDKYNYKYYVNGVLKEESNEIEPLLDKCQKLTRAAKWKQDHPDEVLLEGAY